MEDINEIHSSIMRKLEAGPALVLEIAESIEKDTLQTQTITDYFVSKGEIKKTQRRFGSSPIYYLEKDRDKALDMLIQTLNGQEKALVNKVRNEKVINTSHLSSAERYISQSLTDFMKTVSAQDNQTGEKADYLYEQGLDLETVKKIMNKDNTEKKDQNPIKKSINNEIKTYKENDDISVTLTKIGFKNPKIVEKEVFICDYGSNNLKVIVMIINKKNLTKKDLINAAGYGITYKTIVFIITNAQKTASNKSFGSLVNIIREEL